jgi:hypothetical protein
MNGRAADTATAPADYPARERSEQRGTEAGFARLTAVAHMPVPDTCRTLRTV